MVDTLLTRLVKLKREMEEVSSLNDEMLEERYNRSLVIFGKMLSSVRRIHPEGGEGQPQR